MENVWGLGLSGAYVLLVLGVSSVLSRKGASSEVTRKFVHIALGGWWVIAMVFFTSPLWAAILPAAFIVVNGFAHRAQKLSFMSREQDNTLGTVYYAVSLTLLALFSFWIGRPYVGALGVFCMAFGDGFAAVIGQRFGARSMLGVKGKSLSGSAAMFVASYVSCAVVLLIAGQPFALLVALLLAVVATALELFSVAGLDNLTVPLGVSALYVVLFLPAAFYTPALVGMLLSGVIVVAS
ncbi:MAG: SEC59/DGK1/VTE5 family protein, partial [Raoultibacter sp.]